MMTAFVITLREGLEAFLIVAISLAYLKKTGRHALLPAVHWGIGVSVLLSIAAGVLLAQANNQALWEGVLALTAAVLVASLTMHMWRAGKRMKAEIEGRLEASSAKVGRAAFLGVFVFTLLMITREGMETALLMNSLLFQVKSMQIVTGAAAGTIAAASVAWLWSRYGYRVNLSRFFQVTAHLPADLRRPAPDLRLPRTDRGQHLPEQPAVARRYRALRSGRRVRPVPHLHARRPAARLARDHGTVCSRSAQRSQAA